MIMNWKRACSVALLFLSVSLFSFCTKSSPVQTTTPPPSVPPPATPPAADTATYQLVWGDEFTDTTINTNFWNFETGGNGWGNHEKEYYQPDNASIENGNLVITAKKENVGINSYTSSRMTTQGKKEFTYGKIEARIKIPVGQGLWPAFWMLGANISTVNWPGCGETDIMEHINADSIMYGTIHWDNNGHVQDSKSTTSSPSDYHVYGVEWTAKTITWYVDTTVYHTSDITVNSTDEFHKPFFLLLNVAVGGDWPGQTVDDNKFPAKMYVDYVRVYQKK